MGFEHSLSPADRCRARSRVRGALGIAGSGIAHGDRRLESVPRIVDLGRPRRRACALVGGSIDVYPEYSGTVSEVILKIDARSLDDDVRSRLAEVGVGMTRPLGFNDGYALATTRAVADRDRIRRISDLKAKSGLRLGLTHEFLG